MFPRKTPPLPQWENILLYLSYRQVSKWYYYSIVSNQHRWEGAQTGQRQIPVTGSFQSSLVGTHVLVRNFTVAARHSKIRYHETSLGAGVFRSLLCDLAAVDQKGRAFTSGAFLFNFSIILVLRLTTVIEKTDLQEHAGTSLVMLLVTDYLWTLQDHTMDPLVSDLCIGNFASLRKR